jgi:hypothetical protein
LAGKLRDSLDILIQIMLVIWIGVDPVTGYVFTVGSCAVSWKAVLQPVVALSTTEAEYMAIAEACKELIWLKGLCDAPGF